MNIFGLVAVMPEATDSRERIACITERHCRMLTNNQVPVFVVPNCVDVPRLTDIRYSGNPAFHLKFYYMLGDFLSGKCGASRWSYTNNVPDMLMYIQDDIKMSKFFYYRLIWSDVFIKAWLEKDYASWLIVGGWNEYTTDLNVQGRVFYENDIYDHWGWGAQFLVLNKLLAYKILSSGDNLTAFPDDLVSRKHAKTVRVLNPSLYQHSAVHSSWLYREQFLRSPSFVFLDKKFLNKPITNNKLVPLQYIKATAIAISYLDTIVVREKDVPDLLPGISIISYVIANCDIPVRITRGNDANFWVINNFDDYNELMSSDSENAVAVINENFAKKKYYLMVSGLMEKRFHDAWDYCFLRLKLWDTIEKG
jgi:hypothetical protein